MPSSSWYGQIPKGSRVIEQGDVLENCIVFSSPSTLAQRPPSPSNEPEWQRMWGTSRTVIVITHSCDLEIRKDGTCNAKEVVLCALHKDADFKEKVDLKNIRAGRQHTLHLLAPCDLPDFQRGIRIVDFRYVYSL